MQTAGIMLAMTISQAANETFLQEVRDDLRVQGGIFLAEEKNKRKISRVGRPEATQGLVCRVLVEYGNFYRLPPTP